VKLYNLSPEAQATAITEKFRIICDPSYHKDLKNELEKQLKAFFEQVKEKRKLEELETYLGTATITALKDLQIYPEIGNAFEATVGNVHPPDNGNAVEAAHENVGDMDVGDMDDDDINATDRKNIKMTSEDLLFILQRQHNPQK